MSFDGIFLHAMTDELNDAITGGRITKIQHPYPTDLILTIRQHQQNIKLLLSIHPMYARCHCTTLPFPNPQTPSNFCMLLRKYLEGGIIQRIEQYQNDRILSIYITAHDDIGDQQPYLLQLELMGRHSNLSFIHTDTMTIIDCMKHISIDQNRYRHLLPGSKYQWPPQQQQHNPFTLSSSALFQFLNTHDVLSAKDIQVFFQGFGKDTADYFATQLNDSKAKANTWQMLMEQCTHPTPTLSHDNDKEMMTLFPTNDVHDTYPTLSELCDAFYGDKADKDRIKQQLHHVLQTLYQQKNIAKHKIPKLEQALHDADHAETWRQYGELLTTFLYMVPKGATEVTLPNYYDNDQPVSIPLNPAYSPNKNAQKYFQRYQKLKKSIHIVQEQLDDTKQFIQYLDTVITEIELAQPTDIAAIMEELYAEGFLKHTKRTKKQSQKSQPLHYISTDGTNIYVGKNNLQNDQLTLKTAKKTDYWLHVKNIPGSHVIITSNQPSEQTLLEAAMIAAYHSKYRYSANVPVDYVQVKHVHKPNRSKPGFVIYEGQKTLFVTPDEAFIQQHKQSK